MTRAVLNIGRGVTLPISDVVCILSWKNAMESRINRDMLSYFRARRRTQTIGDGPCRSLVVCDDRLYLSFLSPEALSRRAQGRSGKVFLWSPGDMC